MTGYIKILIIIALLGAGFSSGWWVTKNYYQKEIAQEKVNGVEAVSKQHEEDKAIILDYAQRLIKAGAKHDENLRNLDPLHSDLQRVRVTFPSRCIQDGSTEASADSNASSGVAAARNDRALAEFKRGMDELGKQCAALNVDAIRTNDSR